MLPPLAQEEISQTMLEIVAPAEDLDPQQESHIIQDQKGEINKESQVQGIQCHTGGLFPGKKGLESGFSGTQVHRQGCIYLQGIQPQGRHRAQFTKSGPP